MFTPELADRYKQLKAAGKKVEIVFISSDRDEDAFNEYFGNEMSFLALPFSQREKKIALSKHFKVQGIPTLVFIDGKTGELMTSNGRGAISSDAFIEDFPYRAKPVYDISDEVDGVEDSLIIFTDRASATTKTAVHASLVEIAIAEKAREGGERVKKFFTANGSGGPIDEIRQIIGDRKIEAHEHGLVENPERQPGWTCDECRNIGQGVSHHCAECDYDMCENCNQKLLTQGTATAAGQESPAPTMVILSLSQRGAYYVPELGAEEVTKDNILTFIAGYAARKLERRQALAL
jgi:hypothetical protein